MRAAIVRHSTDQPTLPTNTACGVGGGGDGAYTFHSYAKFALAPKQGGEALVRLGDVYRSPRLTAMPSAPRTRPVAAARASCSATDESKGAEQQCSIPGCNAITNGCEPPREIWGQEQGATPDAVTLAGHKYVAGRSCPFAHLSLPARRVAMRLVPGLFSSECVELHGLQRRCKPLIVALCLVAPPALAPRGGAMPS